MARVARVQFQKIGRLFPLLLLTGCTSLEQQASGFAAFLIGVLVFAIKWPGFRERGLELAPEPEHKPLQMVRVTLAADGPSKVWVKAPVSVHSGWVTLRGDVDVIRVSTVDDARRVRERAKTGAVVAYELVGDVGRDALDLLDPEYVEG